MKKYFHLLLVFTLAFTIICCSDDTGKDDTSAKKQNDLKIVTFNVWYGFGEEGTLAFEEREDRETREQRYRIAIKELKRLDPDIIAIQEANKVPGYAERMAKDLGYDEIHQVINAGLKVGPVGIPTNLKMGIVILAKKPLELEKTAVEQISGDSWGIFTDWFTFHLNESRFLLVGKVTVNGSPLYVCNVHAHASLSEKPEYRKKLETLKDTGEISEKEYRSYTARYDSERERIRSEIRNTLAGIERHVPSGAPVILLGDFNSLEGSVPVQMITGKGFIDTYRVANPDKEGFTWDSTNPLSANDTILSEDLKDDHFMRIAYGDWQISQRIDYIFVGGPFRPEDVLDSEVIMNRPVKGQYASDHFGVMARMAVPE